MSLKSQIAAAEEHDGKCMLEKKHMDRFAIFAASVRFSVQIISGMERQAWHNRVLAMKGFEASER